MKNFNNKEIMIVFIEFLRNFLPIETTFLETILFNQLELTSDLIIPLHRIKDSFKL